MRVPAAPRGVQSAARGGEAAVQRRRARERHYEARCACSFFIDISLRLLRFLLLRRQQQVLSDRTRLSSSELDAIL